VDYLEGTQLADMKRAVKDAGYELGPEAQALEDVTTAAQREIRALRNRLIIAVILAAAIMVWGSALPSSANPICCGLWPRRCSSGPACGSTGSVGALKHRPLI